MPNAKESRPGAESGAAKQTRLAGEVRTAILAQHADDWQRLAAQIDGTFVVIVETTHGRYRRRVWYSLAAAERAARKAQDAGHNAVVLLAALKPLYRVEGAAPAHPALGRIVDAADGGDVA